MFGHRLSSLIDPEGRTHHCMAMIMNETIDWDVLQTHAVNSWPDCVLLEDLRNVKSY